MKRTKLIIAASTASAPVVPDEAALLEGRHFIGIGSFKPGQQELPTSAARIAGHLVIDSPAALYEVGDVIRPIEAGAVRAADVFHIGELVIGRRTVDVERTTVFKSVGMALYDLYVAAAFHEHAVANGVGTHAEF